MANGNKVVDESRYCVIESNSHSPCTENCDQHDFLARAEIQLEQFGNRDHDDVDIDENVVARGDKPENELVDAVVNWGFGVPRCPCT
jgi:hypothetical protein